MLAGLLDRFRSLSAYRALAAGLPSRGGVCSISGLPGSSPAVLTAALAQDFPQRLVVVVAPGPSEAERWLADLSVLLGDCVALYPQREVLGEEEPHLEIAGERMETLGKLLEGKTRVVVTTVRATVERTRIPRAVRALRMELRKGDRERLSRVVTRLEETGYERRPSVLDVAQFAVRGGIVDIYGFGMAAPTRIEWWGDEVVSIRQFDLDTQRSLQEIDAVSLLPRTVSLSMDPGEESSAGDRQSILEILPLDALLVLERGGGRNEVEKFWAEAEHHLAVARRRGEDLPAREVLFLDPESWVELLNRFPRIALSDTGADWCFPLMPPAPVGRDLSRVEELASRLPVLILCDNEGQLERLEELLAPSGETRRLSPNLTLAIGSLHGGFVLPDLVVLTDHEIFNRPRRLRRARRYRAAVTGGVGALRPGDYVVHLEHGIGIYRGIERISAAGGTIEVAVLEYEGGDRLQVPLYRIDQLEPYRTGAEREDVPPRLDRLGSTRWRRQRARTERAVRQLAAELLEVYARRSVASGFAYPPDTRWQHELESSFLYEDTPDQRKATEDVKRDMESPRPMDRLIVGDVGYGKTEVAIRAAFKAVQAGKQVAVLVPTTILAEQHGRTFRERLAAFPVNVAVLSRFRSPKELRAILSDLKNGGIDIVIGTHRLLSRDVDFRDLGLLVIDEEHRFGVRHKERLKALRLSVDVLTLTATPIPRTLHMALSGLRDLTLIETPPRDRSPVLTFVEPWDDELLAEAIARELDRGGQVFVVHNRIETIDTVAARVQGLAPGASVAVAHGRMKERELDKVMRRFGDGDLDILVSTMIVESGLDVPNANTMIVHDAAQFGLAQLYQLRGRVGRGHRRAYCYLLVGDLVDSEAEERLKVLEQHTDLGSGYRIALRDLEIRGAGNLLGPQQSGHAHAVGYDLYLRWLNDAVRALKEGKPAVYEPPDISYDRPAHLPDWYVPDDEAKLDFYRRLARVVRRDEIGQLRAELRDRFGPLPSEAEGLLVVSELRVLGAQASLAAVAIRGDEARLVFRAGAVPRLVRLTAALDRVQFAAEVRRVVPLSIKLTRLGGLELGPGLIRALAEVVGAEEPTVRRKDATCGGS
jgi:transcription-repair coupling factor (superfamily II helicase)